MKNKNNELIGIIAEDNSDINTFQTLIRRISKKDKIGIKSFASKGCGKLKKKCKSWAEQLKIKGCTSLIVVHDLDKNDLNELEDELRSILNPCPIKKHFICIPIEELEAWILSDSMAIKSTLNLPSAPKEIMHPEKIKSPKEYLYSVVERVSKGYKFYIHTKHNEKISRISSIKLMKGKCPSFKKFYAFITENYL